MSFELEISHFLLVVKVIYNICVCICFLLPTDIRLQAPTQRKRLIAAHKATRTTTNTSCLCKPTTNKERIARLIISCASGDEAMDGQTGEASVAAKHRQLTTGDFGYAQMPKCEGISRRGGGERALLYVKQCKQQVMGWADSDQS